MKKPLWNFFNLLKESSPLVLSVDQYFYFFEAFQQLQNGSLQSPYELRDFCKIFWLKNYEYEREFDAYFDTFIKKEELIKLFKQKETGKNPEDSKPTKKEEIAEDETPNQEIIQEKEDKNPLEDHQEEVQKQEHEDFVDFDLLIGETESEQRPEEISEYEFKFRFTMDDLSIMPFKLRHFAQRLRRKVEKPFKEVTDELDMEHMIAQYSKNRYIDEIVYKYKDSSSSNVILLADRFGSMLSYEYVESQLVYAIKAIPDCTFEHYYFRNLPAYLEESGHYEMKSARAKVSNLKTGAATWSKDSWFFILSDGGAHSGMLNKDRMRATLKMWNYLKKVSPHVFWLNPVPDKYMKNSTAQRLKRVIPMINPVQDELNKFFNSI